MILFHFLIYIFTFQGSPSPADAMFTSDPAPGPSGQPPARPQPARPQARPPPPTRPRESTPPIQEKSAADMVIVPEHMPRVRGNPPTEVHIWVLFH